jgi:8-oxo-dGTP pyrophosphatase MutT (NUDIX family)
MSTFTSNPGQIQVPGGIMEPPQPGQPLSLASLRRHAALELVEEVGIRVAENDLNLWQVARVPSGNVGFFFTAPALSEESVLQCYAAMVVAERARGREAEFEGIALIEDAGELISLEGSPADYLRLLLSRYSLHR